MKLSSAIATGRVLVMPASGAEWRNDGSGCARGMALEGAGIGRIESCGGGENWLRFCGTWPWTRLPANASPCGCVCSYGVTYCHYIAHIFDDHIIHKGDWTLDRLIDWIASVEPAEPSEAPAEQIPAETEAVRQ